MAMFANDPFAEIEHMMTRALSTASSGSPMGMDLYRKGDNFVAKFDIPGVDPSTIDIDINDNTLTVRATRRIESDDDIKWLSRERTTGTFARQLTLGRGIATDKIEADYSDGVLTLTMPVTEESKPRKVSVSHSGSAQTIESSSEE
ncbi:MAG: Hsp20/alpha crystallin family protein [Actinomycetaceae bacterium]|nr:Hsp20/alpha crystallin family protein [Actinomycetaceae bacterium]MDY6083628.1 Hsp20/alpha crystallin family protein [Actinomycetaceae bacterium]